MQSFGDLLTSPNLVSIGELGASVGGATCTVVVKRGLTKAKGLGSSGPTALLSYPPTPTLLLIACTMRQHPPRGVRSLVFSDWAHGIAPI